MRNLDELNINIGGRRNTEPPPSTSEIAAFQRSFDLTIPTELLTLLRHSNGGHPELDLYQPSGKTSEYAWGVSKFHFLNGDQEAVGGMWRAAKVWRPILGRFALPFADTQGGDEFFLDLSQTPAPVGVAIHDEDFRVVWLAHSLEEFVDGLALDPDAI